MIDPLLEAKITKDENGCWLWTGAKQPSGYGRVTRNKKSHLAHRYVYQQVKGNITDGLQLDHLCRVRHCVNPDHLEPVTGRENNLRSNSQTATNARKTHCINGHLLNEANVYRCVRKGGSVERHCRTCKNEQWRKMYYRKKQRSS